MKETEINKIVDKYETIRKQLPDTEAGRLSASLLVLCMTLRELNPKLYSHS